MNLTLNMRYAWVTVKCKDGLPYEFPKPRSSLPTSDLMTAGLYRWVGLKRGRQVSLYIGEAGNLYRRLYGYLYRSSSQATSYRVGREMKRLGWDGVQIRWQVLRIRRSKMALKRIQQSALHSVHFRRGLEELLVHLESEKGGCLLNRD